MEKVVAYNEKGQKVIIQTNYKDLEVLVYPKSCSNCPAGFMQYNCGRNVPFKDEDYIRRPDTCKLKLIDLNKMFENKNKDEEDTLSINDLTKMMAFVTKIVAIMSYSHQDIDSNQCQQLDNICNELGYNQLSEDEFRY